MLQTLLSRNAARRPTMHQFGKLCDRLLDPYSSLRPLPDTELTPRPGVVVSDLDPPQTLDAKTVPVTARLSPGDATISVQNAPKVRACEHDYSYYMPYMMNTPVIHHSLRHALPGGCLGFASQCNASRKSVRLW